MATERKPLGTLKLQSTIFLELAKTNHDALKLFIQPNVPGEKKALENKLEIKEMVLFGIVDAVQNDIKLLVNHLCELILFPTLKNIQEAKQILDDYPVLVFVKGIANDPSGRTIIGSPFQCLLGMQDFYADTLGMMQKLITDIDPEKELAQMQFKEQFPEEKPDVNEEKMLQMIKNHVVPAIQQEDFKNGELSEPTKHTLEAFRKRLAPDKPIEHGIHFSIPFLVKIIRLYNDTFASGNTSPTPEDIKRAFLFSCQVVGYLERYLPTHVAQVLCQGIFNCYYTKDSKMQTIDRNLKLTDDFDLYPLLKNQGLGFDFFVGSYFDGGRTVKEYKKLLFPISFDFALMNLAQAQTDALNQLKTWLNIPTPAQEIANENIYPGPGLGIEAGIGAAPILEHYDLPPPITRHIGDFFEEKKESQHEVDMENIEEKKQAPTAENPATESRSLSEERTIAPENKEPTGAGAGDSVSATPSISARAAAVQKAFEREWKRRQKATGVDEPASDHTVGSTNKLK